MVEADVKPTVKTESTGGVLRQKAISFAANVKKEEKPASSDANGRKTRKKKKTSNKKSAGSSDNKETTPKKSDFKGGEAKMNGHVFQLHDESNMPGQFTRTKQEVIRFVQSKYTHGHDIVCMLEMGEEFDVDEHMPDDLEDKHVPVVDENGDPVMDDQTKKQKINVIPPSAGMKKLWEEDIKAFGERRRAYKSNKHLLWALLLGQCSTRLITHLESLANFKKKYRNSDCLWLLSEIHKAMSRFEHTRYPPLALVEVYAKFLSILPKCRHHRC